MPAINEQQKYVFLELTKEAISILKDNLNAPKIQKKTEADESLYPNTPLLVEGEGYETQDPDIVSPYFRHFKNHFPEFSTDEKLAHLLGLSSNRRVREFKSGARKFPYGV